MPPFEKKLYFACLYVTLALIALVNLIFGLSSSAIPYFSISIQLGVIAAAALRQSWSRYVEMTWAGICIIGVLAMWLAFLLRGSFVYSPGVVVYKNVLLVVCLYLILEAPAAFSESASPERTSEV